MTEQVYAVIDEEGKIVLPQQFIVQWGLSPGEHIAVDSDGSGLRLHPPVNSLRRLYVEITNQCNLNCSTCMRNVWDVQYGRMSLQTFQKILAGLQSCLPKPEIFMGGYGEPLSHPECLAMIKHAKSIGLRVSLITNGILLTEEVARALIG